MSRVSLGRAFLGAVLLGACATSGGLRDEALEKGESLTFRAGSERVLQVARRAVVDAGLGIDREYVADDSTRVILASTLLTERELAAAVRVVIRSVAEEETRVRILSRRTLPTEITFGGDPWADRIFSEMVPHFVETPRPEERDD